MKFVTNWRVALTHYSTQALAFGAAIQGVWMAYPDDMKMALGPDAVQMVARLTAIILALGLVGKFIDQAPKDAP